MATEVHIHPIRFQKWQQVFLQLVCVPVAAHGEHGVVPAHHNPGGNTRGIRRDGCGESALYVRQLIRNALCLKLL